MTFGAVKNVGIIGPLGYAEYEKNIKEIWAKPERVSEEGKKSISSDFRQIASGTLISPGFIPYVGFDYNKITAGEYTYISRLKEGQGTELAGAFTEKSVSDIISGRVSNQVNAIYQNRINTGELKYSTPEEKSYVNELATAVYNKEFREQSQFIAKQNLQISKGVYQPLNPASVAITGIKIAAAIAITNPTISAQLFGTGGGGLQMLSIVQGGSLYYKGANIALSPQFSLEERKKGLGKALVGLGSIGYFYSIGSELTTAYNIKQLNLELSKQPMKISGKELYQTDKGGYYQIFGERTLKGGTATQRIQYNLPVLRNIKNEVYGISESGQRVLLEKGSEWQNFFIKAGTSQTNFYDVFSDKVFKYTQQFGGYGRVVSFGTGSAFGKEYTSSEGLKSRQILTDFEAGSGSGALRIKGEFKPFKFGGLSKEFDTGYSVIGTSPKKIRYGTEGIKIFGDISAFGTIEKAPIFSLDSSIFVTKGRGIRDIVTESGALKSVGEITTQKLTKPLVSPIVETTIKASTETLKLATPNINQLSGVPAVSLYYGTGQYERTAGGLIPAFREAQLHKSLLSEKTAQKPFEIQRNLIKTISGTTQKTRLAQITIPVQIQPPAQKIELKLGLLPRTTPRFNLKTKFEFQFEIPKLIPSIPIKKATQVSLPSERFPVLLRRFGKFKIIGYGRTPKEAVEIGRISAARTLGATFKVPGVKPQKIFGFKTKKSKKEGLIFIELPKYRLSKPTERMEIQLYKGLGRKR